MPKLNSRVALVTGRIKVFGSRSLGPLSQGRLHGNALSAQSGAWPQRAAELSDEKIDVRFVEVNVEREKSSTGFQALCHCSGIVMFHDDVPPDVHLA